MLIHHLVSFYWSPDIDQQGRFTMSIFSCLRSLPLLHKQNPTAAANGSVDLLLLGSGWTSTFLLPLAADAGLSTASTTRSGGNGTIQWQFDPSSDDTESFKVLPDAQTVLIVFPIYEEGGVDRLVKGYLESRSSSMQYYFDDEKASTRGIDSVNTRFVLLGSTGIYDNGPTLGLGTTLDKHHLGEEKKKKKHPGRKSPWVDNRSSFEPLPRAVSEQRLLELSKHDNRIRAKPIPTAVLLLCGLWGHGRSVRNFISRLPGDKDVFRNLGSVHLVHGRDVGRAVLALHGDFDAAEGKRWILTNGRV